MKSENLTVYQYKMPLQRFLTGGILTNAWMNKFMENQKKCQRGSEEQMCVRKRSQVAMHLLYSGMSRVKMNDKRDLSSYHNLPVIPSQVSYFVTQADLRPNLLLTPFALYQLKVFHAWITTGGLPYSSLVKTGLSKQL